MGEAAEWEIWRRYGVDISDDGYLENPPKRKRQQKKQEPMKDTDWRPTRCPKCGAMRPAAEHPSCMICGQFAEITGIRSYDDAVSAAAEYGWECPSVKEARHYDQKYGKPKITERRVSMGPENLQQIAKGTSDMTTTNAREAIALIQLHSGAKLYGVKFMAEGFVKPDQKTYTYKDTQGLELGFGDLVIVEAREAFGIAQVVQLDVAPSETHVELAKVRHIVQKIDQAAHNARLKVENEAAQKLAMAEIGERLESYRKQLGGQRFSEVTALLSGADGEELIDSENPFVDVIVVGDGALVNMESGSTVGRIQTRGLMGRKGKLSEDGTRMFLDGKPGLASAIPVFNI